MSPDAGAWQASVLYCIHRALRAPVFISIP